MNPAENYMLSQPEPYRSILLHLQVMIEKTVPSADLKYKYKIPFYYIEGRPFCYLNHSKGFVDVGFWNAAHITVHRELMVSAGRKVIKSLRYSTLKNINNDVLTDVLMDAEKHNSKKFYK